MRIRNFDLTPREEEVIELMAQGYSNKEISIKLNITMGTLSSHRTHIYQKMNLYADTPADMNTLPVRAVLWWLKKQGRLIER